MIPPSITPWKGDEICGSPTPSVASVVSIDSIFSDPDMISPTALETPVSLQPAAISGGRKTRAGVQLTTDDSFLRHDKYFFKDGNITFLVDGTLFCVHQYFFSRDSVYFSTRFAQLGVRDHEALLTVVSMGDVDRKDFEAFLSVLYPEDFEGHNLSYEQWKSVLHLSTRWDFASLRKLAMRSIKPPTPYDQLLLARAYAVDPWVLPALSALCARAMPITLKEARRMSMEDVVLVATVREDIRNDTLPVGGAETLRRIEAAQAEMLTSTADDDSPMARFKSGVAEQEPRSAVAVTFGEGAAEGIFEKEAVSSLTKEDDGHGSDDPAARFKSDVAEQEPRSAVAVVFGGGATEGICKEEAVSFLTKEDDGHGSDEHSAGAATKPLEENIKQADGWQKIPKAASEDRPDDCWAAGPKKKGKGRKKKGEKNIRAPKEDLTVERIESGFETTSGEPGMQKQTGGQGAAVDAARIPAASPVTPTAERQPSTLDPVLRAWAAASSATTPPASPPPSERSTLNLWAGGLDSFLSGSTTGIARAAINSSWASSKQVW